MAKLRRTSSDRVFFQNAIKTLVANIRFASVDEPVCTLAVTSSVPNEGKTTIALNLATALAQGGKKVLLMDCDLRRRALGAQMGLHPAQGLYSVLSGQATLDAAAEPSNVRGLFFLDVEPHIPNPVDVLASRRFAQLTNQAKKSYDYVVLDTPPLSTFVDAAVIGGIVDGTLLVCRQDVVRREELLASYDQLKKGNANVLGVVLNGCDSEKSEYYYSYYTKDGKKVDAHAASSSPTFVPSAPPKPAQSRHEAPSPESAEMKSAPQERDGGLRPLGSGASLGPDSTAQFLVGAGYAPRPYDPDE